MMSAWNTVKKRIDITLDKIKTTPVLDAAAKTALKSVPYLGEFLVNLYDSTGGSEAEKSQKILQILGRLKSFHAQQFKQLTISLSENREKLSQNSKALDEILAMTSETMERLKMLSEGQVDLQESTEQVKIILNGINSDLQEISEGAKEFDLDISAERLVFLINILKLLEQSYDIFIYQNNLAIQLTEKVRSKGHEIAGGRGYDDILRELHFCMSGDEEEIFSNIRKITDNMRSINVRVKVLLNSNKDCFKFLPELQNLYEHLSWWNAKYELLKDNPDMCLIYVGVLQQKPFPRGIENLLTNEIERLVKETRLDVLAPQN